MKTMWEKENLVQPFKCYEIETTSRFFFIMAQSKEQAAKYFLMNINENLEILKIRLVNEENEMNDKIFFVGESGTESFETEWASLNDLISWEKSEFQATHYPWEQPTSAVLLDATWDKTKINFQKYKELYL